MDIDQVYCSDPDKLDKWIALWTKMQCPEKRNIVRCSVRDSECRDSQRNLSVHQITDHRNDDVAVLKMSHNVFM